MGSRGLRLSQAARFRVPEIFETGVPVICGGQRGSEGGGGRVPGIRGVGVQGAGVSGIWTAGCGSAVV
jgi:hypothetical protein